MIDASSSSGRFARDLAGWFRRHARKLTWRQTRDPYAIWVSEVMLQQTRVETVERYFAPFIARFPDVESLARADVDEVLGMWSGLGYYRRARLLHKGAQYLVNQGQSGLPGQVKSLREIPGIGPYTAGAIASIAFDQPAPLVDGNVARVSSRVRALREPKEQGANAKGHWSWVQSVLEQGRPRELAQAVMELGAVVCTPKNPDCEHCPVSWACESKAQGLQTQIPAPKTKAKVHPQELIALALLDRRGRILFEQRPMDSLLAGLWCLPLIELPHQKLEVRDVPLWIRTYHERWPRSLRTPERWSGLHLPEQEPVVHIFTHRRWHLKVALARFDGEWPRILARRADWKGLGVQAESLAGLGGGVPTVTRKLLASLARLPSSAGFVAQGSGQSFE